MFLHVSPVEHRTRTMIIICMYICGRERALAELTSPQLQITSREKRIRKSFNQKLYRASYVNHAMAEHHIALITITNDDFFLSFFIFMCYYTCT